MALINKQHKFIFFHLFKCAGNSMRTVLNTTPDRCYEIGLGHALPKDIKHIMYEDGQKYVYDSYFKFTFIRNPFDWLLSTYNYILAYKNHRNHDVVKDMSLNQFIQYYVDVMMLNEGRLVGQNKCVTLLDYVTDENGNLLVDFMITERKTPVFRQGI